MIKLRVLWWTRKTKKYWKNSLLEPEKYSLQFRNDYVVKKIGTIMKSLKIKIDVKGYENLGKSGPCLLYGNHQDNFDALAILYALKAQTEAKDDFNKIPTFIAKHTLQYKSYTRYPMLSINSFFLDRDNIRKSLETFDKFGKFVKEKKTYGVIFPEGTRNREGSIAEFKAGAFKIAKKEMIPIIPFTINNSVRAMDLKRKTPIKLEVIFHKKIPAHSFSTQNTISLAERVQKIVSSSFKVPEYKFEPKHEELDIENSKAAIKWNKKQEKEKIKEQKRIQKEKAHEERILRAQEKEEQKFEKKQNKKSKVKK